MELSLPIRRLHLFEINDESCYTSNRSDTNTDSHLLILFKVSRFSSLIRARFVDRDLAHSISVPSFACGPDPTGIPQLEANAIYVCRLLRRRWWARAAPGGWRQRFFE